MTVLESTPTRQTMTRPTASRPRAGPDRSSSFPERLRGITMQFVLVLLAALLYFAVRGTTEGDPSVAVRHAHDLLGFERHIGLDLEAGAQHAVLSHHSLVTLANWVYMWGHWPVIATTLVVLYIHDRRRYVVLRNAMFASGAFGLVIFATWPVAPPRLLPAANGYVDTVTKWSDSYRVLQPPALVNKFAAMPSLHVGWNLLVGIALWHAFRRPIIRVFAVASPVLMSLAVVVTANHSVLDGVAGMALALVGLAMSTALYAIAARRGIDLAHLRLWRRRPVPIRVLARQRQIVQDHAVDTPRHHLVDLRDGRHPPCEDHARTRLQRADQRRREQITPDGHTIDTATTRTMEEPPPLPARTEGVDDEHTLATTEQAQ
jgi:hypothetical protein